MWLCICLSASAPLKFSSFFHLAFSLSEHTDVFHFIKYMEKIQYACNRKLSWQKSLFYCSFIFSRLLVTAAAKNHRDLLEQVLSGQYGEVSQESLDEALLKAACYKYMLNVPCSHIFYRFWCLLYIYPFYISNHNRTHTVLQQKVSDIFRVLRLCIKQQ